MTPTPQTKRTVCYPRVSSTDQAKEGFSLADQERAARLYAQMKVAAGVPGWSEITDTDVYTEAGVSGTLHSRTGTGPCNCRARESTCACGGAHDCLTGTCASSRRPRQPVAATRACSLYANNRLPVIHEPAEAAHARFIKAQGMADLV